MGQPYILNLMNKKNNILSGHFNLSYEILDNLRTAIIILDENLNYFYTNTAAYDLIGSSNILKDLSELQCENVSLWTYIENIKEDQQTVMLRDLKFKNFDRIDRIVDCSISSYYSENDKYILIELNETGRLYNISIDQNLIEQQKATREMIKGLSHEIKNPLGGIMGAAQLLDRTLKDESQTKFTKIIRKESERLLKLINAMSSPIQSNQKELINIHEVTEHVIELFKYDLDNSKILFVKDYDPSIPQLNIDKNQIIQALINIIRNAIQAVSKTGKIIIKTRPLLKYTIGDTKHDLVIKLDIIDNGIGIPNEKIKEIFYPMVTTKPNGMGLGLTIAQSIIIQNKGLIECKSKNNETKFSIIIPWYNE